MELNILWLYHDVMDLYGDRGNIQTLKYRCEKRNIRFNLETCGLNEQTDYAKFDLIFMGGGADKEQKILANDLLTKKDGLQLALQQGTIFLLICGGYQLFGQYYTDANGNKIPGLGFYDYYTTAPTNKKRCVGNILIHANLDNEKIAICGFENHGGQTENVKTPLGEVIIGHGNKYQHQFEGFYNGQVIGTYIHGPLLPKNAKLSDFIIKKALTRRYQQVILQPLDDTFENNAFKVITERMK